MAGPNDYEMTALVVPNNEQLLQLATDLEITENDRETLCQSEVVEAAVLRQLQQHGLKRKKFVTVHCLE